MEICMTTMLKNGTLHHIVPTELLPVIMSITESIPAVAAAGNVMTRLLLHVLLHVMAPKNTILPAVVA